jgi:hypothetical protein
MTLRFDTTAELGTAAKEQHTVREKAHASTLVCRGVFTLRGEALPPSAARRTRTAGVLIVREGGAGPDLRAHRSFVISRDH